MNRRRLYRIALVIGWLAVAALAVYAIPHRVHEIITANAAQ